MPSDDFEDDELTIDYGYDRVIAIDNLPKIGKEKESKLFGLLTKLLTKAATPAVEGGIHMPYDGKESKGFAFIEFANKEHAKKAVEQLHNHRLDKSHTFRVNLFSDFDKYQEVPDEFVPPPVSEYKDMPEIKGWLLDEFAREQYLTLQGEESKVIWHHEQEGVQETIKEHKKWTETGHLFSPNGSFVVSFHRPGVSLWGGPTLERIARFPHALVKVIDFSPCENYLVTLSDDHDPSIRGPPPPGKEGATAKVWHIRSGQCAREFKVDVSDKGVWPLFKWSHDDKYIAKMAGDQINVYETPSMRLLDKKSLKFPGVKEIEWSPTANILAVFTPELGEVPARIALVDLPSRNQIRQKNLFNVNDVKIHWQSKGTYLCVKVDRMKSKKTSFTNFELFRLAERDVPIEVVEIKEQVIAFAWEPAGDRFIVTHGDPPRVDVSLYHMRPPITGKSGQFDNKVTLVKTLEKKPVNSLFWSPRGQFVVLAGLKNLNGILHFFNANDLEIMNEEEHFMCTDIEWDPSGRYVCSSVSAWRQPLENGFAIWSCTGKLINRIAVDKFFQFLWRPRPKCLLNPKQEREVRKGLAEASKKYAEQDKKLRAQQDSKTMEANKQLRTLYEEGEQRRRAAYEAMLPALIKLRNGYTGKEDEFETLDVTTETVLDEKIEVLDE